MTWLNFLEIYFLVGFIFYVVIYTLALVYMKDDEELSLTLKDIFNILIGITIWPALMYVLVIESDFVNKEIFNSSWFKK